VGVAPASVRVRPNKALQVTIDPLPIFATAKTGIASNAPELRRWAVFSDLDPSNCE